MAVMEPPPTSVARAIGRPVPVTIAAGTDRTLAMANPHATHRYDVIEPPSTARWVVLTGLATLAAVGVSVALMTDRSPGAVSAASWVASCGAALALATTCLLQWRRSVSLESGILVIRAGLNTRRVAASAIELERARIIDLAQHRELQPGRRTLGASLPGYQSGWFRTREWGKGFYLLTGRHRVLWLPERNGPHVLISLQQPQALLAALNAMAPRHDRG